jgi:hypothetical protein
MSALFTFFIFVVMMYISTVHIYWLRGGLWPGDNYQDLVDKVLGSGEKLPGSSMFVIVIVIFLLMAIFPVLVYFGVSFVGFEKKIFLLFGALFLTRSLYMFLPFMRNKVTKAFLELNKKIYAPICFLLSVAYFYLYLAA